MSVELGMVPVIVRQSALRAVGIEAEILGSLGGVSAADGHLYTRGFMSGQEASGFHERLNALGIKDEDIVSWPCDWVTFATCTVPGLPICYFRYAYLTEAGPGEISEIAGFAEKRPAPRPWASWPPA